MTIETQIKSHPGVVDYFKETPFTISTLKNLKLNA